jgi:hypothetical protein
MDPTVLRGIADLGALGLSLMAVWGFATGRVRVGSLVDKREQQIIDEADRRERQLVNERNEWRTMAETAVNKMGDLTKALEAVVGKKLV